MSEIACLKLSVVLWLVHVAVQAACGNLELPFGYLLTARDKAAAASGPLFGRATRALANYVENLAPFVALDLGLIVTGHSGGFAPTLWIVARAVYIPLYIFSIRYVRSAAWSLSVLALILMLMRI